MSKKYTPVVYRQTKPSYVVEIPWVQTSGAPGSIYAWNNAAQAAVHSILTALTALEGHRKKDVRHWLETAQGQLDDAVKRIKQPRAKIMPYRAGDHHSWKAQP